MTNTEYDKLVEDVIDWAQKEDPHDLQKWEHFLDKYLVAKGWEPKARKQFIEMGDGGFNYRLLHIKTDYKDFYDDVFYCSDRMHIDRLLRCHIQYRTIIKR